MKSLAACSALTLVLISGLSAFAGDPANSMMLKLAVGQRIDIKPSPISNGIEITVYPEKQWKAFPQGYAMPPRILEIYPDYITVELKPGMEQSISAHAIHLITRWVEVKPVVVVPVGPAVVPAAPAGVGPGPGGPGPGPAVAPVAPVAPAAPVAPPAPGVPPVAPPLPTP